MKHGAQIQFGVILAAAAAIALTVPAGLDRRARHLDTRHTGCAVRTGPGACPLSRQLSSA